MTVGVLSLQGDFREHLQALTEIGAKTIPVRLPTDLSKIDRLIIPGGESTTISKLMALYGFFEPIKERVVNGMPVWGTCAGAILMAKQIIDGIPGQQSLDLIEITIRRNGFGRQLDSFETMLTVKEVFDKSIPVVFIRAPVIVSYGTRVRVLANLNDGKIVAVREKNLLATCFHPELTSDRTLHKYFCYTMPQT